MLTGDHAAMAKFSEKDWLEIVAVTHAGMSTADFEAIVADWIPKSKNPVFGVNVTDLVYQPMIEVMDLLRAHDYQHLDRHRRRPGVRPGLFARRLRYPARADHRLEHHHQIRDGQDGKPVLMRDPKLFFNDNNDGKAIGINLFIGKRPQIAFGNTEGDKEMLQWATSGDGARAGFLVLHDDAEREFAYGPANGLPDTSVGTFSQALMDTAEASGWTVISMKDDWKTIFAGDIHKAK